MEPYMTLCYTIKHSYIELFSHTMKKICVILQVPTTCKPKYAQAMMRQLYIINLKSADFILEKAHMANTLGNLCGLPHIFYEIDLLLEHRNKEFKLF